MCICTTWCYCIFNGTIIILPQIMVVQIYVHFKQFNYALMLLTLDRKMEKLKNSGLYYLKGAIITIFYNNKNHNKVDFNGIANGFNIDKNIEKPHCKFENTRGT